MDARLLFPNLYVCAADLIEAEKRTNRNGVTLTISKVVQEELQSERGKQKKAIIYFREMEQRTDGGENKRLVLNKTNMRTIARLYGYETNDWIGKPVTLFPSTCEVAGQVTDCVRVKATIPQREEKPARAQAQAAPRRAAPGEKPAAPAADPVPQPKAPEPAPAPAAVEAW